MNKRNFVVGFQPGKADFDGLQNDMEAGLKTVVGAVAGLGIKEGFKVTIAGSTARVSAGTGFDGVGNPISAGSSLSVDLGVVTRPRGGNYKWITIALRYKVIEHGGVLDLYNASHPAQYLDGLVPEIIQGTEGDNSVRPPDLLKTHLPLIDIRVDSTSPWENLVTDLSRRPSIIAIAEASSRLVKLSTELTQLDTKLFTELTQHKGAKNNPHSVTKAQVGLGNVPNWSPGDSKTMGSATNKFAPESAIKEYMESLFPVGMTYAQYPGGKTPAAMGWPGTWAAQFEAEGIFFRTPGGKAARFGHSVQADAMQGHWHQRFTINNNANTEFSASNYLGKNTQYEWLGHDGKTTDGAFSNTETVRNPISDASGNGTPRTASETRPRNRTFRVWKRTR